MKEAGPRCCSRDSDIQRSPRVLTLPTKLGSDHGVWQVELGAATGTKS